jgi:hypothetical protein
MNTLGLIYHITVRLLKMKQRVRLLIIQKSVRKKFRQYVVKIESLKNAIYTFRKNMLSVIHHYWALITTKSNNDRLKISIWVDWITILLASLCLIGIIYQTNTVIRILSEIIYNNVMYLKFGCLQFCKIFRNAKW